MKQDRRKRIIAAAAVAAILVLAVVLIVSGTQTGTAAPKEAEAKTILEVDLQKSIQEKDNTPEKSVGQKAKAGPNGEPGAETETKAGSREATSADPETKAAPRKETGVDPGTKAGPREGIGAEPEEQLSLQNTERRKETIQTVQSEKRQDASAMQPETKTHVHSYQLVDTRKVDHPAVTKQVWVEESPAWEEVLRPGYHMSVVTCHECGATFADPKQGNALEAWGDHIDAVHNGDGGYDMAASYEVPAETIRHDALGHYEVRTVTAAWTEYLDTYRCSCGDQYTKKR